jgi:hypothetical protein
MYQKVDSLNRGRDTPRILFGPNNYTSMWREGVSFAISRYPWACTACAQEMPLHSIYRQDL